MLYLENLKPIRNYFIQYKYYVYIMLILPSASLNLWMEHCVDAVDEILWGWADLGSLYVKPLEKSKLEDSLTPNIDQGDGCPKC